MALALDNTVVRDRFAGTAVLTAAQATDLGAVGYVARASGLPVDARHDHPFCSRGSARTAHAHIDGDVLSRFLVRAEEIQASVAWITLLLDDLGGHHQPGTARVPAEPNGPRSGVGIVEGWRGTIIHRVELAGDGWLTRVKIVDPSFVNWPALPIRVGRHDRPRLPPHQQKLQPLLRRKRSLACDYGAHATQSGVVAVLVLGSILLGVLVYLRFTLTLAADSADSRLTRYGYPSRVLHDRATPRRQGPRDRAIAKPLRRQPTH